jgi:hypothetical protein
VTVFKGKFENNAEVIKFCGERLRGWKGNHHGCLSLQRLTNVNLMHKGKIFCLYQVFIKYLYDRRIRVSGRITRILSSTPGSIRKSIQIIQAYGVMVWSLRSIIQLQAFLLENEHGLKQGPGKQRICFHQRLSQQTTQNPKQPIQRMLLKYIQAPTGKAQLSKIMRESSKRGDGSRI